MKRWLKQMLTLDARLSRSLYTPPERAILSLILKVFAHSGDSWFWMAGLFIVWIFSSGAWRERAVFLSVGLVIMAAAVILLKVTIRRPRPEGEWGSIYRITDPHSFPSGHAARSAALAVMGLAIGPGWFGLLLTIWAPWVGLSRVSLGVHYLSDVFAGWLVGVLMGLIALSLYPLVTELLTVFI
ncbi:MAG: phosphatase PAP2 family protein [Brevefilum sp.]